MGMPTISIRESLQMALLSRNETHQHWVKPTSNSIDQRNHLFCAGYINIDQEMSGIRHLRIERGNIAYLWIPTTTPLNGLEALEAAFWLHCVTGWSSVSRRSDILNHLSWVPVPVKGNGIHACMVDGPILKVPGFAQRTATLISNGASGWSLEDLSLNQRSVVAPHLSAKFHDPQAHLEACSDAYFTAIKSLASEGSIEAAIEATTGVLQLTVLKYQHNRKQAALMAQRLVSGIVAKSPKIVGAYQRKRDQQMQSASVRRDAKNHAKTLTPKERLEMFNQLIGMQSDRLVC